MFLFVFFWEEASCWMLRDLWCVWISLYFAKIEKLLLKVLQIKVKANWNNTVKLINSAKKCSETYE